jgi:hypothetical protein
MPTQQDACAALIAARYLFRKRDGGLKARVKNFKAAVTFLRYAAAAPSTTRQDAARLTAWATEWEQDVGVLEGKLFDAKSN